MKQVDPALAGRVPPGQTLTGKWPVLTYGLTPRFDPARWTFRCFGLVERAVTWTWPEFLKLPRATVTSDVHCVTRWSKLDNVWEGVPIREIVSRARPRPEATFVMQHADPDYTTNIALADLVQDDVLLAIKHNGRDLEPDHGGPMRLVVPKLYFWKSAKWLRGFEFLGPGDARHAADARGGRAEAPRPLTAAIPQAARNSSRSARKAVG